MVEESGNLNPRAKQDLQQLELQRLRAAYFSLVGRNKLVAAPYRVADILGISGSQVLKLMALEVLVETNNPRGYANHYVTAFSITMLIHRVLDSTDELKNIPEDIKDGLQAEKKHLTSLVRYIIIRGKARSNEAINDCR